MIVVVGEALIDLILGPDGSVAAVPGGAPFNTARACGRLGADVAFVGAVSVDRFGERLIAELAGDGVDVSGVARTALPTTLAAAELDERGAATYRFYIDGTSAPALPGLPQFDETSVMFTGGLGLVLEPMATTVEAGVVAASSVGSIVVVDVNCRPLVVRDREAYLDRVERVTGYADVVKVSDEDLAYLAPGVGPVAAARAILERGPAAVLVTGGGVGVRVVTASGERFVPVDPVDVVDTIGAGDTFGGAFIAWLVINGARRGSLADVDLVERAVRAANTAAGIACTRRGADPPRRSDLPSDWAG